jgi:hypothetical protein
VAVKIGVRDGRMFGFRSNNRMEGEEERIGVNSAGPVSLGKRQAGFEDRHRRASARVCAPLKEAGAFGARIDGDRASGG